MTRTERSSDPVRFPRRFATAIAVLTAAAILGGCSQVPDYMNPVEWYRGTKDWITGDDETKADARPPPPMPGEGKPFPGLSSVPPRPTTASTTEERAKAAQSLTADSNRARYTDQVIRRQADMQTKLPRKPQPSMAAAQPAAPVRDYAAPLAPPAPAAPSPVSPFVAPAPGGPFPGSTAQASLPLNFIPIPGTEAYRGAGLGTVAPVPASDQPAAAGFGSVKLATVFFGSGSSRISRDGTRTIRKAYQAYKSRGGVLRVVGHASSRTKNLDPMRHRIANFRISIDRANRVARALIRLGAKPEAVFIDAMSDTDPVFFEVMPAGEAANRRVEIHLEK